MGAFKRIFHSQANSISGAVIILMVSYFISGILGLLRNRFLIDRFGLGAESSIYLAAFRVPDLIYNILIFGAVSATFLPIFAEYYHESKEKAWQMTNNILNVFFVLLVASSVLLFILSPFIVKLIVPGFSIDDQAKTTLLMRILLIQPILLGVSNIFSGVLQYFNRFLVFSFSPVLYNAGIIFGILFLSNYFGLLGAALGVVVGAVLHLLIQIPSAIHSGFKYKFLFNFKYPAVLKIFSLMIPRIISVASNQINLIFITSIASTISAGSITIFNYANDLQGLPIGVFGVSLATAIFPTLTRLWASGQKTEFIEKIFSIFKQGLYMLVPASILIVVLRAQIVRLMYGTKDLAWQDTRLIAACLGIFALSLFITALIPFLVRAFFSFQDTKTPTIVSIIFVSINIILSLLFVHFLGFVNHFSEFIRSILKLEGIDNIKVIGLVLSLSISFCVYLFFIMFFLHKKLGGFTIKPIFNSFFRILVVGLGAGFVCYFSLMIFDDFFNMKTFLGIFYQASISFILGIGFYSGVTFYLKFPELEIIKNSFFSKFKK